MKVTAEIITRIQRALSDKGMNQSQLADKMKVHRSTVSTLLKGNQPTITAKLADKLNDALDIRLEPLVFEEGTVSPTALRLTAMAEGDAEFSNLLETLVRMKSVPINAFLPQVDTKKLPKIGAAVTRIVMKWEEGTDPHYSKIAVEVLDFLREFYSKSTK